MKTTIYCLVLLQQAFGQPDWLQPTYNLETHLTQLIGDYYKREQDELNNLWILKPWNMARTIDTSVTSNISGIIRLMETGPKICQKYIEHPALFQGKKFDLRYIVLVRSMNPLELFLADVFWVSYAANHESLQFSNFVDSVRVWLCRFGYQIIPTLWRSTVSSSMRLTLLSWYASWSVYLESKTRNENLIAPLFYGFQNYRGAINHKNTPEFVREFEDEHKGTPFARKMFVFLCRSFKNG